VDDTLHFLGRRGKGEGLVILYRGPKDYLSKKRACSDLLSEYGKKEEGEDGVYPLLQVTIERGEESFARLLQDARRKKGEYLFPHNQAWGKGKVMESTRGLFLRKGREKKEKSSWTREAGSRKEIKAIKPEEKKEPRTYLPWASAHDKTLGKEPPP